MLGDLLISGHRENENLLDLPTRFHPSQPSTNPFFSQMSQKVLIVNPQLAVAWAGQKIVAKHLVRRIANELREPYNPEQILEIIYNSELSEQELASVSFIFMCISSDGLSDRVFIQDYLTGETVLGEKEKVKYAGTGTFHFFDSIAYQIRGQFGDVNDYERFVASFVSRMAIALYEEIVSDITHNFFYGGGFELLVVNPLEKRFVKVPLTFAFWRYDAKVVELVGPVLALNYKDGENLSLHRLSRNEKSEWILKSYVVRNLLNEQKSTDKLLSPPDFDTFFSIHYLLPSNPDDNIRLLIKKGVQKSVSINYTPKNSSVSIDVSPEFLEEVRLATV